MQIVKLTDDHPGMWNQGVEVALVQAKDLEHDKEFTTGVRTNNSSLKGVFSEHEGPLQVIKNGRLTMSCLGVIPEEVRQKILAGESVLIGQRWDSEKEVFVPGRYELKLA